MIPAHDPSVLSRLIKGFTQPPETCYVVRNTDRSQTEKAGVDSVLGHRIPCSQGLIWLIFNAMSQNAYHWSLCAPGAAPAAGDKHASVCRLLLLL